MRQRTIFIGVRNDLKLEPVHPKPLHYQYTVRDACPNISFIVYGKGFGEVEVVRATEVVFQCFGTSPSSGNGRAGKVQRLGESEFTNLAISDVKKACAFPDDFILTGSYAQQWERLGRAVPPVMMSHIAKTIQLEILEKCVD
jgi:DNA (cytosine-5)-methyltransferase 1